MTIKVKVIGKPTKRTIRIQCTNCNATLERYVPINAKEGKEQCGICGTKLQWREE